MYLRLNAENATKKSHPELHKYGKVCIVPDIAKAIRIWERNFHLSVSHSSAKVKPPFFTNWGTFHILWLGNVGDRGLHDRTMIHTKCEPFQESDTHVLIYWAWKLQNVMRHMETGAKEGKLDPDPTLWLWAALERKNTIIVLQAGILGLQRHHSCKIYYISTAVHFTQAVPFSSFS